MKIYHSESFGVYRSEIRGFSRIVKSEEARLIALAQKGDARARKEVVAANLDFVVKMAKRMGYNHPIDIEDLIQAGNEGLLAALDKFDITRDVELRTYASSWVCSSIRAEIKFYYQRNAIVTAAEDDFDTADTRYDEVPNVTIKKIMAAKAVKALKKLPNAKREVIARSFGLLGCKEETLASIGESKGRSRERIRQIQNAALQELQAEVMA